MIFLKLTKLWSGVAIPNKKRRFPGYLIEIGKEKLLFDCGAGTVNTLTQLWIDVNEIKFLFLTHYHIDHVCEYPTFVKARVRSRNELKVYGPSGLEKITNVFFKEMFRYMSEDLDCFQYLRIHEVKEGLVEKTDKWKVSCIPVKHFDGVAYRLESDNKSILYSGDSTADKKLTTLGKDCDLAILECSFPDKKSLKGLHMSSDDIGKIANEANFKKVVLTHFYPESIGREKEIIANVKKQFDGEVLVAEDFMTIEI